MAEREGERYFIVTMPESGTLVTSPEDSNHLLGLVGHTDSLQRFDGSIDMAAIIRRLPESETSAGIFMGTMGKYVHLYILKCHRRPDGRLVTMSDLYEEIYENLRTHIRKLLREESIGRSTPANVEIRTLPTRPEQTQTMSEYVSYGIVPECCPGQIARRFIDRLKAVVLDQGGEPEQSRGITLAIQLRIVTRGSHSTA